MNDITKTAVNLFGTLCSIRENVGEYAAKYESTKKAIAKADELLQFVGSIDPADVLTIHMEAGNEFTYRSRGQSAWEDEYNAFLDSLEEEDSIEILVHVEKAEEGNTIRVYNFQSFEEWFTHSSLSDLLIMFAAKIHNSSIPLMFDLLNINGRLQTKTIVLKGERETLRCDSWHRKERLLQCEEMCIFLDRERFPLLPDDFNIEYKSIDTSIEKTMCMLRNTLSYVYLANCSSIKEENVFLQFNAAKKSEIYTFDELKDCDNAFSIYKWVVSDNHHVDKAGIARSIIDIHCTERDKIISIPYEVLSSIRSNYRIYETKATEKYIEIKKEISEYIIDASKQILEITQTISEGVRNNFIALIMFVITTLLTDKIDINDWYKPELPPSIVLLGRLFAIASIGYLFITVFVAFTKWRWVEKSYNELKGNYADILDDEDINVIFHDDSPIKSARNALLRNSGIIVVVWLILLFCIIQWFGIKLY